MISFGATNSFVSITNENKSFSSTIPDHWNFEDGGKLMIKLNKLLELRSGNHIKLHVEEVAKRIIQIEIKKS